MRFRGVLFDATVLVPVPEAKAVLDRLRAGGVLLAVVAEAGPDLRELDEYFQMYVDSSVLGRRKPDPLLYHTGSDGLGLLPEECLFVDADPEPVRAAIGLGYHGVTLVRAQDSTVDTPWVPSLDALVPIVLG